MSRSHEPHQPFFPFGNPFRMFSPKGSHLSKKLLLQLNTFEETLAERLRKLNTKDKNDILSLSWMKSAMESLCNTHNDIKDLITELELPVSDWDEKWIDVYLDISVNLLDICIAFSSELSRLNQGNLLLQCVLHNLESALQMCLSGPVLHSIAGDSILIQRTLELRTVAPFWTSLRHHWIFPRLRTQPKGRF
jgi:hypothetical protein